MEKRKFRVLIKHYHLRGKTPKDTKEKLDKYYGESAPSYSTVKKWISEFKMGRTSTDDGERSGRPSDAITEEIVIKVHRLVMEDRKIKVRELAEVVKLSTGSICTILHEHLHVTKVNAKWVPRMLTLDQKRIRSDLSESNLKMYKRNPSEFIRRFITMDETWIHFYTPESQQQSKQWIFEGESAPKRPKTQQSAGKVMASVFWDARGIILVDYLQKGKTITGAYYASLLDKLNDVIKQKRPHLHKKKILYHHDNAPSHSSLIASSKLHELRYKLLPQPAYSPDLAPSDFYLFPNLKRWLCGKRFESNKEVIAETNSFEELTSDYFFKGNRNVQISSKWP